MTPETPCSDWNDGSAARIEALAQADCVRAIGETGLDFNRSYSPPEAQQQAFCAQMELAVARSMPLFCHQRDAHAPFVEMLGKYRDRLGPIISISTAISALPAGFATSDAVSNCSNWCA